MYRYRVTSACEADVGVFFAYTDKSKGHKGITAFLVPLNTPGLEIGPREEKLGIRASSTCDIFLNNVQIPQSNVIGDIGNGFEIAMRQLQLGRIGVAAQAIGIGQAAFDLAKNYSIERTVLGERLCDKQLVKVSDLKKKIRIGHLLQKSNCYDNSWWNSFVLFSFHFQSKLAQMATNLESARLLCMSNLIWVTFCYRIFLSNKRNLINKWHMSHFSFFFFSICKI